MSKTVPTEATPQPGDRRPDTGKIWALCTSLAECPEYPAGRWVTAGSPHKLEAAGYKRRCHTCAQRQRWTKPDAVHPRLSADNLPLLDGSTALLLERSKEDIRNRVSLVVCGVCGETPPEKVNITSGDNTGGVCDKCLPWLTLLLTRKQYTIDDARRSAVYAKIRRVRSWLAAGASSVEPGPGMPFWALAESWAAWYRRVYEVTSWGVYMAYFRHFILYFEDKPIDEIGVVQVREVEEALLSGAVCREPLAQTTVTKALELLRRIFKYGKGEGWLKEIPFQPMAITRAQRRAAPARKKPGVATRSQSGNGKVGRRRKFTDEQAYEAIDALGSRLSVSQLAKSLNCARVTVNDWVEGQGHASLDELANARRAAGGVGN
jgi:hypothetical protein